MEKLICSACGAPLAPDSAQPFITCEYCDTAVENKYYVAVVEREAEPAVETAFETLSGETGEAGTASSGGSLLKTLLGAGAAIAVGSLRNRSAVVRRPSAARPVLRGAHPSTPHRHPEPPRAGGMGARPMRRRQGGMGMGGRGGRGGMGGPGGRHR